MTEGPPATVIVDGYGLAGPPWFMSIAFAFLNCDAVSFIFRVAVAGVPRFGPVRLNITVCVGSIKVSPHRTTVTVLTVCPGVNVTACPATLM